MYGEKTMKNQHSALHHTWQLISSISLAVGLLIGSLLLLSIRAQAQAGGIEGAVTYYGTISGTRTIQIAVFTTTAQPLPPPVATTSTDSETRRYAVAGLEDDTYFVYAYLDLDDDAYPDAGQEPFAWYDYQGDGQADPVTVEGGPVSDIDLLLTDLWQPLGGPLGQVNAIAVGPDILYAAVGKPHSGFQTHIYTSTDGAATWAPVYTDTTNTIRALAVTDSLAYAAGENATRRGLILKSQNDGVSWTRVFTGTGQTDSGFRAIAVDPAAPGNVYAAGLADGGGAVYRSQDGGLGWERVLTATGGDLLALTVNPVTPSTVYAGGYYREDGTQVAAVYRSINGGTSWTRVYTATEGPGQQFTSLAVHPLTPTLVYAGTQTPKVVYRSDDGGDTWSEEDIDRGFRLALDPPATVYAADDWREIAKSTDGGDSWTPRVGGLTPGIIESLAIDGTSTPGTLYLGLRDNGIYESSDGGLTWQERNEGIEATTAPYDIEVDPQNRNRIFVAAGPDGGWRTVDGGQTWERRIAGDVTTFAAHPQDTSVVYAGIADADSRAVLSSTNGGFTFTTAYASSMDIYALAIAPADPDVVYAGGEDGDQAVLIRSDDSGTSWSEVLTLPAGSVTSLAIHPLTASVAYVGVEDGATIPSTGVIYRTADGGGTWDPVYASGNGRIHTIVIDPQRPTAIYATDDREVVKSSDGGATWSRIQSYSTVNPNLLAIDSNTADHVYLAGPGYVAETIDGGQTWSDWTAPLNQGTEGRSATALTVDGGGGTQTLYAGFSGVWYYTRPSLESSDFTTERVLGELSQPTAIDWSPDGRMFIAHQDGRVLVYADGNLTTFVNLSNEVNNNWNRGLLGIEVHPDFPAKPYVYLLYTYDPPGLPGPPGAADGDDGNGSRVSRLVRLTADGDQDYAVAETGSKTVILGTNSTLTNLGDPADAGGEDSTEPACTTDAGTPITDCLPSEGPSHSIGWLEFGHDGALFVSNGEGAPYLSPDPRAGRAQNLDSLGGKILRINPDTGEGLSDNPFYDGDPRSNRSRVWSYGLRNPFRFALHPDTNTLYAGDVGWYSWEELNTGRGDNFGWPCYEGGASGNIRHTSYRWYTGTQAVCDPLYEQEPDNGIDPPLYAYQNVEGAAIVAGDFYTGTRYPAPYRDALFIADYDKRWIKYLSFDESGNATVHDFLENVSSLGGPVQLTLGPDGYLYYVALNPDPSGASEIRRVLYTSAPSVQIEASPTSGYRPLRVHFTSTLSSETEQALTYDWAFGDGGSSVEANPVYTYTEDGTYTATLEVATPRGRTSRDWIRIVVGDTPPTATIEAPTAGSTYTMGTSLTFRGSAVDDEDGDIDEEYLQWNARIFYNGHFHPDFFKVTGVSSGTLQIPYHNDNTTLFICLTATDRKGLKDTECVELFPRTVRYTFDTDPSGLRLTYDGTATDTPFEIDMMVNAPRSIAAPTVQNGLDFIRWSDGGKASHEIVGQPTPQTLVATYRARIWLPLLFRDGGS
jgi:glucose/arabinose dehydrogenase/photosystem II stability/assembly factor-like uncharacterized protein